MFLFNKQTPDFEKLHKKQREQILEMLRKGPNHLVRLRHPRLLIIDHPLEESKLAERKRERERERERERVEKKISFSSDCLAFATEPVTIGLANILGNYDNLPSPLPLSIKVNKIIYVLKFHFSPYSVTLTLLPLIFIILINPFLSEYSGVRSPPHRDSVWTLQFE